MKSIQNQTSKLISIIQIIAGAIFTGAVIYSIYSLINFGKGYMPNFEQSFSITKTFIRFHFKFLLGLAMVAGGILYLKKEKVGYAISIGSLFFICCTANSSYM
jgi:uncharacterized membrane protein YesL